MSRIVIIASVSLSLINFRESLIDELVSRGHEVIAVAPKDNDTDTVRQKLLEKGVHLEVYPLSSTSLSILKNYHSYCALRLILKKNKPNIVIAYTAKPIICAGLALKKFTKIKFYPLITGLGYGFIESKSLKRKFIRYFMILLYRRALKLSSGVIFQNPDDKALFHKLRLIPINVSTYIINGSGVDLKLYPYSNLPKKKIFLMLARLLVDKGVREYSEAARFVRLRFPNVIFRLAGKFDKNPSSISPIELQSWINEGHIEYLGDVSPVQPILTDCRFYVLPSYREGTPQSVLEALATGRPIITTDVPGCRETVIHGKNGLLIPAKNAQDLATAMIKLLEEKEEVIQKMARASYDLARNKYDVIKVNRSILNIFGL